MAAARPLRGDQARALQGFLDEGVAEGHAVLGPGPPQEVADVEAVKAFAIKPEQPFDLRHGRPLGGRRLPAPVEHPLIAIPLVHEPQAPDAARAAPEDIGGLQPGEPPTEGSQDDLLDFHRALHDAAGIGHGHLLGDQFSPGACLERSFHAALGSGQITYSRHPGLIVVDPVASGRYPHLTCKTVTGPIRRRARRDAVSPVPAREPRRTSLLRRAWYL